jgi:hypothetical protein
MTPLESGQPLTALALLTGQDGRPGGVIDHAPLSVAIGRNLGALQMLPSGTLTAAVGEVSAAVSGLLDVSLIGMLVAGWRAHHDLTMAARRTLAAPGITELVRLATHEITVTLHPSVTVLVDGRRVATLDLDLSVVLDVTALLGGVRDGRLIAVRSGRCDITATLAIGGTDVISRQASLQLPGVIPLNRGIPLLAAAAHPSGPRRPVSRGSDEASFQPWVQPPALGQSTGPQPSEAAAPHPHQ